MHHGACLFFAMLLLHPTMDAAAADYRLLSGRDAVCTVVLDRLNHPGIAGNGELGLPEQARPEQPFRLPPPLDTPLSWRYDFDNDGVEDRVFRYDNAGSYLDGTLFYVVPGAVAARRQGGVAGLSDVHIFPCQFDAAARSAAACPPVSQAMDGAGVTVRLQGDHAPVFFSGRYTVMEPIRFRRMTFLILRGRSRDNERYAALIRPFGATHYASTCLFRR